MHTVCNIGNRVFFRLDLWPQVPANACRHIAVYLAYSVLKAGTTNGKRRHVEIIAVRGTAQREKVISGNSQIVIKSLEISGHHIIAEVIVPCLHSGMGSEYRV